MKTIKCSEVQKNTYIGEWVLAQNNRAAVRTLRKMLRRALCNLDAYAVQCGQEIKEVLRATTERKLRGL